MDENLTNEVIAEGLREDFYQALNDGEWDECRATLAELEEMKVSTYELRREMNQEMDLDKATSEPDDFTNAKSEDYGL